MSGLATLVRLLLRPMAAWNAFVCGSLAYVAAALVFVVRGGVGTPDGPEQALRNAHIELALGSQLLPLAFGTFLGAMLVDLRSSSFAALLPGLEHRILRGLSVSGLIVAALTAWWCAEQPGAQRAELFFGLGLLWFSAGVASLDVAWLSLGRFSGAPQLLVLAPLLVGPEIVAFTSEGDVRPVLAAGLAALAGLGLLRLGSTHRIHLARQAALAGSATSDGATVELGSMDAAPRARSRWSPAVALGDDDGWTRAVLHEGFGNRSGGWLGAIAGYALVWSVILVAMVLVAAFLEERSAAHAARYLHATLVGGEGTLPFVPMTLCTWAAMFFLSHPVALRGAGPYPLSRARRARVTWRASARTTLAMAVVPALVLWATSALAARLAGVPVFTGAPPEFAIGLLAAACGAPLAQLVRLRWHDERDAPVPHATTLSGLVGFLVAVPAIALAFLWRAGADEGPLAVVGSAAALIFASQHGWRRWLDSHYAKADLAA